MAWGAEAQSVSMKHTDFPKSVMAWEVPISSEILIFLLKTSSLYQNNSFPGKTLIHLWLNAVYFLVMVMFKNNS